MESPKTRADQGMVQGFAGAGLLNPADVSCVVEKGTRKEAETMNQAPHEIHFLAS